MEHWLDYKAYHYLYLITRPDGCYYVGIRSTDDVEDDYWGSGNRIVASVKKYGKDYHTKEILYWLNSRREAELKEYKLVNEETLKDPLCMNLCPGGRLEDWPEHLQKQYKQKGYVAMMKVKDLSAASKKGRLTMKNRDPIGYQKRIKTFLEKGTIAAALPEAIQKKKETFSKIGHQQKEKNSAYHTVWVHKENEKPKRVNKKDLNSILDSGWKLGRLNKVQQNQPKKKQISESRSEYNRLKPVCRNKECGKELKFSIFRKGGESCSKECSNATRILKNYSAVEKVVISPVS